MNFVSRIPYQYLTIFTVGTLIAVFVGFFVTEYFFSSIGVVEHTKTSECYADYLRNNSITDDFFNSNKVISDDEDLKFCNMKLQQFYQLKDIKTLLYTSYDTSEELCKEIDTDKTKKLCISSSDIEGSENQQNSNIPCINVKTYLTNDLITKHETSEMFYAFTRDQCDNTQTCFNCVKDKLNANNDYMHKRLHARTIKLTYIGFDIWKYFQMWPKVDEINQMIKIMEDEAVEECKKEQKCSDSLHLMRKQT